MNVPGRGKSSLSAVRRILWPVGLTASFPMDIAHHYVFLVVVNITNDGPRRSL